MSRPIDADALIKALVRKEPFNDCARVVIAECMEEVRHAPTINLEPKWIPCSEKLPEDGVEVFIYLFDRPDPYIAWIEDTHWYTEDFKVDREEEPIAWMPLPKPYMEEGKGK